MSGDNDDYGLLDLCRLYVELKAANPAEPRPHPSHAAA